MTDHRFTDAAPLTGARITADGYMVAEVRCARTGCQDYLASDFGIAGNGVVTVYRPEEAVFDKASLATFAGKPLTLGHPAEPVTADNWKTHAAGDIGPDIARDGEYVRVQIKVMDAGAISAVRDGTRELSAGYTTPVEMRDGVAPDGTKYQAVQTGPIRINHLAIVPRARGGSNLRIGDAESWGIAPIINRKDAQMPDGIKTRTVMVDGLSVETTDAGAQALEKLQKDAADAKAASDKVIAAKDAELATRDATIADLKAKVLDAAALDNLVRDHAELMAKAKVIAPAFATDKMDAKAIRRGVVVAVKGTGMADKSDAYIDAMFDILAADAKACDPAAKALGDMAGKKAVSDRSAIYDARDKELSNAWKGEAA